MGGFISVGYSAVAFVTANTTLPTNEPPSGPSVSRASHSIVMGLIGSHSHLQAESGLDTGNVLVGQEFFRLDHKNKR